MENRKINITDNQLDENEINDSKNFESLNKKYKNSQKHLSKIKLYSIKNKKYLFLIILIIIILIVFFME